MDHESTAFSASQFSDDVLHPELGQEQSEIDGLQNEIRDLQATCTRLSLRCQASLHDQQQLMRTYELQLARKDQQIQEMEKDSDRALTQFQSHVRWCGVTLRERDARIRELEVVVHETKASLRSMIAKEEKELHKRLLPRSHRLWPVPSTISSRLNHHLLHAIPNASESILQSILLRHPILRHSTWRGSVVRHPAHQNPSLPTPKTQELQKRENVSPHYTSRSQTGPR